MVGIVDLAGNPSTGAFPAALTFDHTPPEVLGTPTSVRSEVRHGQVAGITFTVSEPLRGDPVVMFGTMSMTMNERAGTTYTYTYEVLPGDSDGSFSVDLTSFHDRAGNPGAPQSLGTISIDNQPPAFVSAPLADRTRLSHEAGFDRMEVAYTLGEVAAVAELQVGDEVVACNGSGIPPTVDYACEFVVPADYDNEGAEAVTVLVTDGAGNFAVVSARAVTFDFTPPGVAATGVGYLPDPSNPLGSVTAATVGTEITVNVIADEALDPQIEPTMSASFAGETIAFTTTNHDGTGATFEATITSALSDGNYTPAIVWTDEAGNESSDASFSPPLVVKTSQPVLAVAQNLVTYWRSPWGNAAPEALGTFTVPAGPYFALAPADPLAPEATLPEVSFQLAASAPRRVRIWADAGTESLMATMGALPDGSWPRKRLASLNTPVIFVTGVDSAGNESEPVKIENAVWVASSNPAAFGVSPHLLEATVGVRESVHQSKLATTAVLEGVEGADSTAAVVRTELLWRERRPTVTTPRRRTYPAIAYDSASGVAVLFGGRDFPDYLENTWQWDSDSTSWLQLEPVGDEPRGREAAAAVYDSKRGVVVMFGGYDGASRLDDTWEWEVATSNWTERASAPGDARPSPRTNHAMAYDSARGVTVLFGGHDGSELCRDTWEWDGNDWVDATPTGAKPTARSQHAMAYDSNLQRVILFGGFDDSSWRGDLWSWDGAHWWELEPVTPISPIPREPAMTYDHGRAVGVLFGGRDGGVFYDETWEWDGSATTWISASSTGLLPAGRSRQGMAYDSVRGAVMVFAGYDGSEYRQDSWLWDGTSWLQVGASPTGEEPDPRGYAAMEYDRDRDVVVLFGGRLGPATSYSAEVWEWHGASSTWTNKTPSVLPSEWPAGRSAHAMAYDSDRRVMVLFGGYSTDGTLCGAPSGLYCADTWEWDGATATWTERVVPGDRPDPRMSHAMAYDASGHVVVLFAGKIAGGLRVQDTWEWDGTAGTWSEPTIAGSPPDAREEHDMAYDSDRGVVVLFGGFVGSPVQDTWEWDGSSLTWTPITPAGASPPAQWAHAMAYDSVRERVVLVGTGEEPDVGGVWEWDGVAQAWHDETPRALAFPRRAAHSLAFDESRGVLVAFGGLVDSEERRDVWERESDPNRQPAFGFSVDAGGAGIALANVTALEVRAHCGGESFPYDAASAGATLYRWSNGLGGGSPGEWLPAASNDAGVSDTPPHLASPNGALLTWETSDPIEVQQSFMGTQLHFQCRPIGVTGVDTEARDAVVAIDYIEARVRYRPPDDCGDGIVGPSESCDDDNALGGDGCSAECLVEVGTCGDGVRNPGEVCDDGNTEAGDGCSATCTSDEECGTGVCDAGLEDCASCADDCGVCPVCPNDILEAGETCDGPDFGGLTCVDFGYVSGELSCNSTCDAIDSSSCVGTGNCCDYFHGPGCSEPSIESCVCLYDPSCCSVDWDFGCVAAVNDFGCGICW